MRLFFTLSSTRLSFFVGFGFFNSLYNQSQQAHLGSKKKPTPLHVNFSKIHIALFHRDNI